MANSLFFPNQNNNKSFVKETNKAGGSSYEIASAEEKLAKWVCTSTLSDNYVLANPKEDISKITYLVNQVSSSFLRQAAMYAADMGLKDAPIFLLCHYITRNDYLADYDSCYICFHRVVTSTRRLRSFVQMMRSGTINGRKSLGTRAKKLVNSYLAKMSAEQIFSNSVGNSPSLQDILNLSHYRPNKSQQSTVRYLMNKETEPPKSISRYINWNLGKTKELPDVHWMMLMHKAEVLSKDDWFTIITRMSIREVIKNLNTFQRRELTGEVMDLIVHKLSDVEKIKKEKILPYEVLSAICFAENPHIKTTLYSTLLSSVSSIPDFSKYKVAVMIDDSGSMSTTLNSKSKVRNIDVAACIGSIFSYHHNADLFVWNTGCNRIPKSAIGGKTLSDRIKALSQTPGGGTDITSALHAIKNSGKKYDLVIIISDNESWVHRPEHLEKLISSKIKYVCIDVTPSRSYMLPDISNILHVSGFNDRVFGMINDFVTNGKTLSFRDKIARHRIE